MMPQFKRAIFAVLTAAPLACVSADSSDPLAPEPMPYGSHILEHPTPTVPQIVERKPVPMATSLTEATVAPFTGKIRGKKVRMRLDADLDSRIIRELDKNELVSVVGEKGNFYAVQPPSMCKAYVFRSFVLDNVIEGSRVNIRLEPDLEATVIGHFNGGEHVQSSVAAKNNKWLEIGVPSHIHFYIAKDFVENIGGPDVKEKMDKRKTTLKQTLDSTSTLVQSELHKAFDEIDMDNLTHQLDRLAADSSEFPDLVERIAEVQQNLQETYTQKKLAYHEEKSLDESTQIQEETIAAESLLDVKPTDKMLLWQPIEEALYLNWCAMNHDRSMHEYYKEQRMGATKLSGVIEAYTAPVRNKPGDFILKDRDLPIAYIYSTNINLQDYVGKRITVMASPRPNNNFAWPAFFILSQE